MERKTTGLYTSKNGKTFAKLQITLATNEITSLIWNSTKALTRDVSFYVDLPAVQLTCLKVARFWSSMYSERDMLLTDLQIHGSNRVESYVTKPKNYFGFFSQLKREILTYSPRNYFGFSTRDYLNKEILNMRMYLETFR